MMVILNRRVHWMAWGSELRGALKHVEDIVKSMGFTKESKSEDERVFEGAAGLPGGDVFCTHV